MDIGIQRDTLGLKGQRVNQIKLDEQEQQLVIHWRRDKRRNAIAPVTAQGFSPRLPMTCKLPQSDTPIRTTHS